MLLILSAPQSDHTTRQELDGDVLGVGGRGTVAGRQEPPTSQEPAGHLMAGFGQLRSLGLEERLKDRVTAEQCFAAPDCKGICVYPHLLRPS
jgi:hypothetical protein